MITFTSNIQSKAFDETLDVDDLMQEAEGKLFEISQQNITPVLLHKNRWRAN